MKREDALQQIEDGSVPWDVLVIGGGATGLGCAVEAAARQYRTLLIEGVDFAQATSSRSTKLIHGGFRYLKQGNINLVRDSLRERAYLLKNAPHLVYPLAFVLPHYSWWERPYYFLGLKIYDFLAGQQNFQPCQSVNHREAMELLPTLNPASLKGGLRYYDAQFDDARLAVCLARTVHDLGSIAINHFPAVSLLKINGRVSGVVARDLETGCEHEIRARVTINAAGIFADSIRRLDQPKTPPQLRVSQGTHLVLDKEFLPGQTALMVPRTKDGRVLFAIPWQNRVVLGTTDVPVDEPILEPQPMTHEIDYLLEHIKSYLPATPSREDIRSVFAGLRPLVSSGNSTRTSRICRDHVIQVSPNGLVNIMGGKWTTYRLMAADTLDQAARIGGLEQRPSQTKDLKIHGWRPPEESDWPDHLTGYGSDQEDLLALGRETPENLALLHPDLPYQRMEVLWAVRHEMARTVEDVLARRTRALFLDAAAAVASAPLVATLLARELGQPDSWIEEQIQSFPDRARQYLPPPF